MDMDSEQVIVTVNRTLEGPYNSNNDIETRQERGTQVFFLQNISQRSYANSPRSILWGAVVDKKNPDKYEIIGSLIVLSGAGIIFYSPR